MEDIHLENGVINGGPPRPASTAMTSISRRACPLLSTSFVNPIRKRLVVDAHAKHEGAHKPVVLNVMLAAILISMALIHASLVKMENTRI